MLVYLAGKTVRFSEQIIFSRQMEAIVYMFFLRQFEAIVFVSLEISFATRAVLKTGEYHLNILQF